MDAITRDAYLRRIRFLRDRCGLRWLAEEASGYAALDSLGDAELVRVQAALERARECVADDVPFEDADLVPGSWSTPANFANHVSLRSGGVENVANHVSPALGAADVHIPWYRLPENPF